MQSNSADIKLLQQARDRLNLAVRLAKWLGAGSTLSLVALINPFFLIFLFALFAAGRYAVRARMTAVIFVILFAVAAASILCGWALQSIAWSQNPVWQNWGIYADPEKWQKAIGLVCLYAAILWAIVRALPAAVLYHEMMQPPNEVQTVSHFFKQVMNSLNRFEFAFEKFDRVSSILPDRLKTAFE